MLRRILIIFFVSFYLFSTGQEISSETDSLITVLETAKDIDKFSVLIKLSNETIYEEEGINYAKKAYDLAKKLKDTKAEIEALNAIGKFYVIHFEEVKSLEYFFEALNLSQQLKDNDLIGKVQRNIGQAYYWLDSLDKANHYTKLALELSRKTNNRLYEADALIDLGMLAQREGKTDSALVFMNIALKIRYEENSMLEVALAYGRIGRLYFDIGDFQNSIKNHQKEIEIKESLNDLSGLAIAYNNLGRIHRTVGSYQLALEQYQKSLSTFERLKNKTYIASVSSEIGLVYESLSRSTLAVKDNLINYNKALEFHRAALKIYEEEENLTKVAQSLNNIANNYSRLATNEYVSKYGEFWEDSLIKLPSKEILSTFTNAFEYYNRALTIFEKIEDTREIANVNINLGSHYIYTRDWEKSRQSLSKALSLARQIKSQQEIALALFHFGEFFFRQNNLESAEQYLIQSLNITKELGIKEIVMFTHQRLAKVNEQKDNLPKALSHYKSFNLIKDELFSEQSQKIITEMQTKYETDKKEQELKLMRNQDELQKSVIQRQKLTLAITIGGLVVFLAFAVLLINMIRQKQKANKILEEKNALISLQKLEITDSIRYASRIQNAILPSPILLKEMLKEHFVLFLPRNIVSGDFYWYTKQQNKIVLVAADCTGHGVPGAFMSMLGVSSLYEIVNKEGVMQPAQILNMLRDFIKQTLSQTGKQDEQKDGMDISLCMLDTENMKLEWAGAYNPLLLIRNGEITEYKADKMPVAIHITDHQPFTNHVIDINPDDRFYMYSDGFADQFGGDNGRKYMSKRFKQLLIDIHQKPMDEQKEILHQEHLNWRGDSEQIDDIVVFGVRV
ncbi:MAG: tetratricopeptide repeat protein [Tenuifilaceae bacterium]|nr:tetratricopeptide repeat protein [Tenuifilaceae bacterium]